MDRANETVGFLTTRSFTESPVTGMFVVTILILPR